MDGGAGCNGGNPALIAVGESAGAMIFAAAASSASAIADNGAISVSQSGHTMRSASLLLRLPSTGQMNSCIGVLPGDMCGDYPGLYHGKGKCESRKFENTKNAS